MKEKESNIIKPRQITVNEMAPHVHGFSAGENKVAKLTKWLSEWIESSLENGKIKPRDFLPSKRDLASHIGVSLGTMQNVFRNLEDSKIVESKQKIGTFIIDKTIQKEEKLTSKRDLAVEIIKHHILKNNYKRGDRLLAVRKLAKENNMTPATTRNALNTLIIEKILIKKGTGFLIDALDFKVKKLRKQNLTEKISKKIEEMISKNGMLEGDKLPSNQDLANMFRVSIKTIHQALKLLAKNGKIYSKRGKYGTVISNPDSEVEEYFYEQVEQKIKLYIIQNSDIGAKLPSIKEFSAMFNVSTKTVKKALDEISDEGYVTFSRGRYGGTFVTDIPQGGNEAYTWLALSSDYLKGDEN